MQYSYKLCRIFFSCVVLRFTDVLVSVHAYLFPLQLLRLLTLKLVMFSLHGHPQQLSGLGKAEVKKNAVAEPSTLINYGEKGIEGKRTLLFWLPICGGKGILFLSYKGEMVI